MSDLQFNLALPHDWDEQHRAWKSDIFRLPGRVLKIYAGGDQVPEREYKLDNAMLLWNGAPPSRIVVHYDVTAAANAVSDLRSKNDDLESKNTDLEGTRVELEKQKLALEAKNGRWKAIAIVLTFMSPLLLLVLKKTVFASGEPPRVQNAGGSSSVDPVVPDAGTTCENLLSANPKASMVFPGITMLARLEWDPVQKRIWAVTRMIYDVVALRQIDANEKLFGEWFDASSSEGVEPIPGADPEMLNSPDSKVRRVKAAWNVLFPLAKGERRTVITGVRERYPTKLGTRDVHFFRDLGDNDEAFCYPNDSNDAIGEIVILVESGTLNLSFSGDDSAGIGTNDSIKLRVMPTAKNGGGTSVVVARFNQAPSGVDVPTGFPGILPGSWSACLKLQFRKR